MTNKMVTVAQVQDTLASFRSNRPIEHTLRQLWKDAQQELPTSEGYWMYAQYIREYEKREALFQSTASTREGLAALCTEVREANRIVCTLYNVLVVIPSMQG